MLEAARLGQREAWKRGLVGFENLDAFRERHALGTFQAMHAAGELGLRATIGLPRARLDEALALGLRTGFGDQWLRVGHLKMFADGALGSQTAALDDPYEGSDDRGILTIEPETLTQEVARAAAGGIAVAIHAIGDRAVHVALDAIASTRTLAPALRQKIEHLQLVRADDIERFARLGVVASMQPIHATSDRDLADRYWGPERVGRAYPWRRLLAAGAVLAFGSDSPVEPIDPLLGIHAAVARRRPGDADAWTPSQRLTPDEALAAYAAGPAYALGREKDAGTLAVGRWADAAVIDRDITRLPEEEIAAATVRATVTGGVIRYESGLG
jgi:predicted amidohydrolase YtcJ